MDENEGERAAVARLESRAPGADEEDPYEGLDLEELPGWWRRAVEEFRAHGLRPYRPPRFDDGAMVHEVVGELEAEHGVEVSLGAVGGDFRAEWEVRIDGEPAGAVGRHRSPRGYTVFEIGADRFRELVRSAVGGQRTG